MVTAGSRRKVWWQCPEGHVWKAVVYSRAGKRKCGCPVCAGRISESADEGIPAHGGGTARENRSAERLFTARIRK
ncbi:MAG: zinc-ribbon domain-containing protein [Flavonifractor plautii]